MKAGVCTKVAVEWSERPLYLAADAATLRAHKVRRGMGWTSAELEAVRGLSREDVAKIAEAKLLFDGEVLCRK